MTGTATPNPSGKWPALRTADELAIGQALHTFYSAFDNRGGLVPDFTRLRQAFSPTARILRAGPDCGEG